ncbi:hypothetical protein GW17_00020962 [Ensete ventricosum]|nr:hypothetical protein GW17_00020962 [Ensete ventricosum]
MATKHKSPTSGSFIHPRLSEAIGGRQSIAGSKHNTFYHFLQRSIISHKHQSTKGHMNNKVSTYIGSTYGTTKYICAIIKQYNININIYNIHSYKQRIKYKNT